MIGLGLDLRLPAEAVRHGQVRVGLPLVLDEQRRLDLRDVLRARLFDRQPADARLLQVQEQRAGDAGAGRAAARHAGRAVGTLHVVRAELRVVEEPVGAAEDVAAVGEPDEGLRRVDAVELEAGLDRVAALDPATRCRRSGSACR